MKRFIAIDGLDGSGKDTQARLIKEKYEKEGTVRQLSKEVENSIK